MNVLKFVGDVLHHQAALAASPASSTTPPAPAVVDTEGELLQSLAGAIPALLGGPYAALFSPLISAFATHHATQPAPGASPVPAVAWQLLPQLLAHVQAPGSPPK